MTLRLIDGDSIKFVFDALELRFHGSTVRTENELLPVNIPWRNGIDSYPICVIAHGCDYAEESTQYLVRFVLAYY